ncbi:Ribonuclease R [compost metagenome]
MISVADLTEWDDFSFIESDYALVGLHTNQRFRIGDRVNIQVVRADLERKQIDFAYVADPSQKPRAPKETKDGGTIAKAGRNARQPKNAPPKAKKAAKKPKQDKE